MVVVVVVVVGGGRLWGPWGGRPETPRKHNAKKAVVPGVPGVPDVHPLRARVLFYITLGLCAGGVPCRPHCRPWGPWCP